MKNNFEWNSYADQPHNVAPKSKRFKHHLKYLNSYVQILFSNLSRMPQGLKLYRKYRKNMYKNPVMINDPFGLSFTPSEKDNQKILHCFNELNIKKGLFRIPSWELDNLNVFKKTVNQFLDNGIDITIALLQQRADVIDKSKWDYFLESVFSELGNKCQYYEIGHAWNRTKWGIWDYKEYLKLAESALSIADRYNVNVIGPAVIDFEFHLYPPVLKKIDFNVISSLLYVDCAGAPENKQYGWDLQKKLALLKASVDASSKTEGEIWVTEFNWPLKGTGKYSPASGKPNVTEREQADYLSRYLLFGASCGFVERFYWWQLTAQGYGLIDNKNKEWRKRPAYYSYKTLVGHLRESQFLKRLTHSKLNIFYFKKEQKRFSVCWCNEGQELFDFEEKIEKIISCDGEKLLVDGNSIEIDSSPKYVFFD